MLFTTAVLSASLIKWIPFYCFLSTNIVWFRPPSRISAPGVRVPLMSILTRLMANYRVSNAVNITPWYSLNHTRDQGPPDGSLRWPPERPPPLLPDSPGSRLEPAARSPDPHRPPPLPHKAPARCRSQRSLRCPGTLVSPGPRAPRPSRTERACISLPPLWPRHRWRSRDTPGRRQSYPAGPR